MTSSSARPDCYGDTYTCCTWSLTRPKKEKKRLQKKTNNSFSGEDLPSGEKANPIFEKLPEPVPPSSFSTTFSSGPSGSGTSSNPSSSLTSLSSLSNSQCTFTYEELSAATDNFSTANILGEGGFGRVYKGKLSDGREVAIKMLKGDKGGTAEAELQSEAAVICRVHHRHLVSLVGLSVRQGKVVLVFEFVPNKTLQFHLHGNDFHLIILQKVCCEIWSSWKLFFIRFVCQHLTESEHIMDWPTRLKVAIGSAKGLAYLHEECEVLY
jgi:Protein tyrosine and serine/threonine kinase